MVLQAIWTHSNKKKKTPKLTQSFKSYASHVYKNNTKKCIAYHVGNRWKWVQEDSGYKLKILTVKKHTIDFFLNNELAFE